VNPSATHQNFVFLLRAHPEMTFELARRAGIRVADRHDRFEQLTPESDNVFGGSVRPDLALVGYKNGRPVDALVVEVQLGDDRDKEWTVTLYQGSLKHTLRVPVWVLILSPARRVRRALERHMFQLQPELRPAIVSPSMVPIERTLANATVNYAWAVLAAAMHATGPDAVVAATVAVRAVLAAAPPD